MPPVSLEDLVVIAGRLPAFSRQSKHALCLEVFEARHNRHKIRKKLGSKAAARADLCGMPAGPDLAQRHGLHQGLTGAMLENLSIVTNALLEWRRRQAARGGAGLFPGSLYGEGKMPKP